MTAVVYELIFEDGRRYIGCTGRPRDRIREWERKYPDADFAWVVHFRTEDRAWASLVEARMIAERAESHGKLLINRRAGSPIRTDDFGGDYERAHINYYHGDVYLAFQNYRDRFLAATGRPPCKGLS